MKTATISDVTKEEFDEAVQTVISGIKASDPKLDTRLGTVLRSLLVNPEARIEATVSKQIEYTRKNSSLKNLRDAQEAGEEVDVNDVNSIMSNFNITSSEGTKAEGIVKISVVDGSKVYTVPEGTEFRTVDGLVFYSTSTVVAAVDTSNNDGTYTVTSILYEGSSSYFLLVPVEAKDIGVASNIPQGTSLETPISLYTYINAEAYKSFNGGSDVSNIQDEINKIPAGLSIRGFVNKNACEGMLRDEFDSGNYPIIACSTVGYGNAAQRRDKHNLFGVGIGGRIDLYVRNFGDLFTIPKILTGTKKPVYENGTLVRVDYTLKVTPEDFPGSYWVKEVSSTGSINSSLEFSCKRRAYDINKTWHDFDVSRDVSEAFNTIWHGLDVTVHEVPQDLEDSESSDSDETALWSDDRQFVVTVYCLPEATKLQSFVDKDNIRSVSTDVVVRCPIICNVEVFAKVVYDVNQPIDVEEAKYKIRKYINGLGFVNSLTRSEIVHILKSCGAVSVSLEKKDMLYGTIYDAFGKEYKLSGDSLSLNGLAEDAAMLSQDTTVFAVEPENIQLTITPNK